MDVAKLREKLHTSRRRTLASNGITVVFNDPSTFLRSLLLKEMVVDDEVILLYRLSINEIGDIVGYYNTNLDYLCSPTEVNANHPASKYIDALVLFSTRSQSLMTTSTQTKRLPRISQISFIPSKL